MHVGGSFFAEIEVNFGSITFASLKKNKYHL